MESLLSIQKRFTGTNPLVDKITYNYQDAMAMGSRASDCRFEYLTVAGDGGANVKTITDSFLFHCDAIGSFQDTVFNNCNLSYTLDISTRCTFVECVFNGVEIQGAENLKIDRLRGELALANGGNGGTIMPTGTIDLAGGTLTIDSTCDTGTDIIVTGYGELVDNSQAGAIITDKRIPVEVSNALWEYERP